MRPEGTASGATPRERPLALPELIIMVLVVAAGLGLSFLLGVDRYNTSLGRARGIFYVLEASLGFWSYWALLRFAHLPRPLRLPAALWGFVIWSGVALSGLAYIGYVMIPVEVLLSGAALRIRGGVEFGRALGIALGARAIVLAAMLVSRPVVLGLASSL